MSGAVSSATTSLVRDTCLCLRAQSAARALARYFDAALRPVRLTNQQFSLLMALNRSEPPRMGPVAELLAMDRTTLTAALKPLQRRGLVRVVASPTDRRARILVLTAAGRETLARAVSIWRETHAAVEGRLVGMDPHAVRAALALLAGV